MLINKRITVIYICAIMTILCDDLILKIAGYDDRSRIYFTRKDWYKKWRTEGRWKNAIQLQRWYRKRAFNRIPLEKVWKSKGLMVRLYLNIYSNSYENFLLSLPDAIIEKQNMIHYIMDWETDTINGLADAYRVFNQSQKKKSDVIRFLLTNKMTVNHYNIHGV
jgi:hypothetical protein